MPLYDDIDTDTPFNRNENTIENLKTPIKTYFEEDGYVHKEKPLNSEDIVKKKRNHKNL